ncbi:putative pentatricopeptide repeat-containing protein [Sesamum angolense]|uniref:Pentatricopeptide repeat-containing protein n=1 Tax=Sesamum angolense TaxID=2727404 RepID=A0AAE2BLS0_9LAMI|nr:putative pentatricopeptide repeat-containing protein [Sesamum angolense]
MEDSSSPLPPSTNPSPKLILESSNGSRNTIHIGGIPVEFPYQPYGTQLAFMNRLISTLDRSQRDGHCHALLESPTGTGKSLSLLCSALAWQQNQKLKNVHANLTHSSTRANPEAVSDPINHGGGFIPETQPSGNPVTSLLVTTTAKKEKKRLAPMIFYSSRTHTQISQVIREYKKTSYRVPMAVLGSRKHYCTNPYLRGEDKVDEQCKLLLKNRDDTCPEFKNVHKVKGHPSLQKGGCHEVHDIEDLVKVGQVVKGCSYFAARSMAQDAELVFCPYNYIINPVIREAMEVDISGSIIIFDEAHNIEDIARDAGSIDLDEEVLLQLGQLSLNDSMTYQPLFEMTQDILSWIDRRKNTLVKREFQNYFRCWTGDKALKELEEANVSLQSFPILQECAKRAASEAEPDIAHLSGRAAITLEGLFSSLNYFFAGNGAHAYDYQLALQRFVKKDEVKAGDCDLSGKEDFSPLNTFSSELGVQFGTCLEAPHVIDVDSQVWAAAIANGPGNYPLNASYKTADEYAFQDAVGSSLEEICKIVPGGCLVFFPSYKLLDKVSTRWQETGQWSQLNAQKSFFVEPRGSSQDSFERVLKGYYNSIRQGRRQVSGRKIRGKKLGLTNGNMVESQKDSKKDGAAFLAVCRGKKLTYLLKKYYAPLCSSTFDILFISVLDFINNYKGKCDSSLIKRDDLQGNSLQEEKHSTIDGGQYLKGWISQMRMPGLSYPFHILFSLHNVSMTFNWANLVHFVPDLNLDDPLCQTLCFNYLSYDIRVAQKKKFNDTYKLSKNLLSGNEWYCQQAFRALNQATGRCIRHRFDYGAIIFLEMVKLICRKLFILRADERFHKDRNRAYISKWLRNSIRLYSCFEESLDSLKSFFRDVKDHIGIAAKSSEDLDADCLNIKSVDKKNDKRKKNNKVTKSSCCQQKVGSNENFIGEKSAQLTHPSVPVTKYDTLSTQTTEVVMLTDDKDARVCREYIDLECDSENELRWSATPSVTFSSHDLELTIVKETPDVNFRSPNTTPEFFSKDDYSTPSTNHRFIALPQQSPFQPSSVLNLHDDSTNVMCSTAVATPKTEITSEETIIKPEAESPWSVNSSVWKRRKIIDLSSRTEDMNHSENGCCGTKSFQSSAPSRSDQSHVPSGLNMDERLQIFCSRCKNLLGLPENDFSVMCSVISTSKVHLMSLKKKTSDALSTSTVDVLVCDTSYLDQRLATTREGASGQGIWCKEDGCVFNSIFCPFCYDLENCLGVQVVATDGLNVKFQNKTLFYLDQLEVKNFEAETKTSKVEKEQVLSSQRKFIKYFSIDTHVMANYRKDLHIVTQAWQKMWLSAPLRNLHMFHQFKIQEAGGTQNHGTLAFYATQYLICNHKMSATMRSTQLYLRCSKLIFLRQPGFDAYLVTTLPAWNEEVGTPSPSAIAAAVSKTQMPQERERVRGVCAMRGGGCGRGEHNTGEVPVLLYGTQVVFMNRLVSTLARWQRDGQCQGLLDSPTGTRKSLSPLCSVLALQQKQKLMNLHANLTHSSSRSNPDSDTDPINHGGGFIPETQPSGNPVTPTPVTTNAKREETRLAPIFYTSYTSLLNHHRSSVSAFAFSTLESSLSSTNKNHSSNDESHILSQLSDLLPVASDKSIAVNSSTKQLDIRAVDDFLPPEDKLRGVFLQKFNSKSAIYHALSGVGIELNTDIFAKVVNGGNLSGESMVVFFNWAIEQWNFLKDVDAYHIVLKALGRRKFFVHMMEMLKDMRDKGMNPNPETLFIIMDSYVRARQVSKATKVFGELEKYGLQCNKETFCVALKCLSQRSRVGAAWSLFNKMRDKVQRDCTIYNIILGGWSKFGRVTEVEKILKVMVDDGIEPDCATYSYLIESFGRAGRVDDAVKIFKYLEEKGNLLSPEVYNAMIFNHIANGDIDGALKRVSDAIEMLDEMLGRGIIPSMGTVTEFLKPLCSYGPPHAALVIYKKARKAGCGISLAAYKLLLMRLSRFGKFGMMLNIWDEMQESGHSSDMQVYEYIINGLCNTGKLETAVLVMEECIHKGFFPSKIICSKLNNKLMDSNKVEIAYKLFLKLRNARTNENAQRYWRAKGWHF